MAVEIQMKDCWAKTDPETGKPSLSVHDHCITVGTVAETLLAQLPQRVRDQIPEGAVCLIAAHDIGKITPGFQLKSKQWTHFQTIWNQTIHDNLCTNHAIISQWHLVNEYLLNTNKLAAYWLVSTGGHHGRYPVGCKFRIGDNDRFEGGNVCFQPIRDELLRILMERFGPLPKEVAKNEEERIHLLTGFTIFSDWIGSNADWFPSTHPMDSVSLIATASNCLNKLKWRATPIQGLSFGQQFNQLPTDDFQPRNIQSALLEIADSPGLYIVEAPMGMGKTEAALTTAYQRWTHGDERGLYFALSTQLTSNKIHERIQHFLGKTIGNETVQTLIHSTAWLKEGQSRRLIHIGKDEDANDTDEALRWYSSTRKQLLAPFGTGTIDQALLSVLPARFAALRYFALAGKVVVIDEVHSFDPYMSALIDRLVQFLIKGGSTVIILSATLIAARRAELVKSAGADESKAPTEYPLITKVATGSTCAVHTPVTGGVESKPIRLMHEHLSADCEDEFWDGIVSKVESGANVVVIRNTVALAQSTYRQLKSRLTSNISSEHVGLLHSRFPQNQRDANEGHWTSILGKSDTQRPKGSLLIATQIVEQSVDIDADCMVTDLAPTELILQRIGRLHRHKRARPGSCEQATCHILHPNTDWKGTEKEVKDALKPHHFIYPSLSLWRASEMLLSREMIRLPDDIRPLLEGASALTPTTESSSALQAFSIEYTRKRDEMLGTSKTRGVFAEAVDDTEGVETRYCMKPSAQLVILPEVPAQRGNEIVLRVGDADYRVRHGEFSYPLAKALQQVATRIPAYLVRHQLINTPVWLKAHMDSGVIAVSSKDTARLELYPSSDASYSFDYREDLGVTYEKIAAVPVSVEEDDFWF